MKRKKIITCLIAVALVITTFPTNAMADQISKGDLKSTKYSAHVTNITDDSSLKGNSSFVYDGLDTNKFSNTKSNTNSIVLLDLKSFKKSDEQKRKNISKKLKADFDEGKSIAVYGTEGNPIGENTIFDVLGTAPIVNIKPFDDTAKSYSQYIVGNSIQKRYDGTISIDTIYNVGGKYPDQDNINHVTDACVDALTESDKLKVPASVDSFTAQDLQNQTGTVERKQTFNWYNGTDGTFVMKTFFNRYIYGSSTSSWVIEGFNQADMMHSTLHTLQVRTRYDVSMYGSEQLSAYQPTTTNSNYSAGATASVSLSGPSVGGSWSFSIPSVACSDLSSGNYARWSFDYQPSSNASRLTHVTQPGATFTNSVGAFGLQVSSTHTVQTKPGRTNMYQTGVYTYFINDRGYSIYY